MCLFPHYGGSIQGLARVPEGHRLEDQRKEAWGGGMWIDLYRNEHENVKIFESYVTHRIIWRDAVLPNTDRMTQQSVPLLLPLASGLVQWRLNGVSRGWGHTWAQQHELLLIKANLATDCVRCPPVTETNAEPLMQHLPLRKPSSRLWQVIFAPAVLESRVNPDRKDTPSGYGLLFPAACPQPASLLKDLQFDQLTREAHRASQSTQASTFLQRRCCSKCRTVAWAAGLPGPRRGLLKAQLGHRVPQAAVITCFSAPSRWATGHMLLCSQQVSHGAEVGAAKLTLLPVTCRGMCASCRHNSGVYYGLEVLDPRNASSRSATTAVFLFHLQQPCIHFRTSCWQRVPILRFSSAHWSLTPKKAYFRTPKIIAIMFCLVIQNHSYFEDKFY